MRLVVVLVALGLVLVGVAVGFPAALGRLLGSAAGAVDAPELAVVARGWLEWLREAVRRDLPWMLIGAGVVLLLAGGKGRPVVVKPELAMVFDIASAAPRFVERATWTTAENEPVAGTAYRVGVRNLMAGTLPAVIVTIQVQGGHPASARFVRDGSYCADIAAGAMELVDIFMYLDQQAAAGSRLTETMTVRAGAPGVRTVAKSFRFDSAAKETLVEG